MTDALDTTLSSVKSALAESPNNQVHVAQLTEEIVSLKDSNASLKDSNASLKETNASLKARIRWFEKQLFGITSEKRIVIENPYQGDLLSGMTETPAEPESLESSAEIATQPNTRGKAPKRRPEDSVTDRGLRFSDDVPVEIIEVIPHELQEENADDYEIIETKVSRKLAKRPASYVVLEYHLPVIKKKATPVSRSSNEDPKIRTTAVRTTAMPDQVLEGSIADVSLLAGLLIDKFLYHLPLHRQHQQLQAAGITLSRSSLTTWTQRSIELLRPIVEAQLNHVLTSRVLAMDETPIKAGRKHKGKMKTAYFWPVYGDSDEVVFTYSQSRGQQHIVDLLKHEFDGTLVTDGYAAYARYVDTTQTGAQLAQCWVHSRRYLVNAQDSDPEAIDHALGLIGQLYQAEQQIKDHGLSGDKKRQYRLANSRLIVDQIFAWLDDQSQRPDLTPTHPLTKAIRYIKTREAELRVFLEDPDVPLDTNHVERQIRSIPLGKKNWMFCWTELGAEHVGLIQSLICTCKLHDINPHTYLTDVLQRVAYHPMNDIQTLTPRLWKEHFTDQPLRSALYKK